MKTLGEGRFLRLKRMESGWEFVERTNCTWAVVIAALTDQREVVFVEQLRPPVGGPVIELPAGLIGDGAAQGDESWREAAERELEEETGFAAAELVEVARGPISPGLSTESIVLVRATGLRRISSGGGVKNEAITIHLVPLPDVDQWLARRAADGALVDPKLYAGLYFLQRL
jgi:ADP-ribose pyrophosphatase